MSRRPSRRGAAGGRQDEPSRIVSPVGHLAVPAALAQLEGDVADAAGEARAGLRRAAERGADVVGVQPRVVPERLDAVAERALVAAGRRAAQASSSNIGSSPAAALRTSAHSSASSRGERPARSCTSRSVTSGVPRPSTGRRRRRPSTRRRGGRRRRRSSPSQRLGAPTRRRRAADQLLEALELVEQTVRHHVRGPTPCCPPGGCSRRTCVQAARMYPTGGACAVNGEAVTAAAPRPSGGRRRAPPSSPRPGSCSPSAASPAPAGRRSSSGPA